MDVSSLHMWLSASQILLASGALAVVVGAVGVVRFSAAKEHIAVAEAVRRLHVARSSAPAADLSQLAALRAENAGLQTELAAAQHDLKAAEVAHSHLQAALPRALTESQKDRLLAALKSIPGPPEVDIFTISDPEAALYADQIIKTIEAAGYRGRISNLGVPTPLPRDVHLHLKPGDAKGAAIKYAFQAVGIPVTVSEGDTDAFDFQITIGVKP